MNWFGTALEWMGFRAKYGLILRSYSVTDIATLWLYLFEFSHNYNMQNIDNLESLKSTAETSFKMCLIINTQGFHDK